MERIDYLVVGAGFAGSVCAERLASAGKSVLVIDQRAHIGGNAYDYYNDDGILVHKYGAHIFHTNSQAVVHYLSQFTSWRAYTHRVLSSVDGQLLPVPINRTTLAAFSGDEAAARAAMIEPYTRKQWGPYAAELSPTVLARIRTRDNDDDRYFTDTFQAMPAAGYTRLFERMLAHENITIMLKASYQQVIDAFGAYLGPHAEYGRRNRFGDVVSPEIIYTGPIDEYFDYRFGRLPYRSARFEWGRGVWPGSHAAGVINYPDPLVSYTRIANMSRVTGHYYSDGTAATCREYPSAEGEPFWPVPTAASAALYKRYEALAAQTPRVHFVGRLGRYQYLDIHQVVAQALALSAKLIAQSQEAA